MRLILAAALLLAFAAPALAAEPRTTLPDVEDEVMCAQCGTALNISNSPVADQERAFIRRRIAEGKTKAEIKAAMVEEYGPGVLATPGRRRLRRRRMAGARRARAAGAARRRLRGAALARVRTWHCKT